MNQSGLPCTINVVTDFIVNPSDYHSFRSGNNESVSISNLLEMQDQGHEIACHGHTHKNTINDITKNIGKLKSWGIKTNQIGFASPHSYIYDKNIFTINPLIEDGTLMYVRSGVQIKRKGFIYLFRSIIQEIFKSKKIFYGLNKKLLFDFNDKSKLIYGISITNRTTVNQIKHLINKMPKNSYAILIFHSVLNKQDKGYGKDKWYWSTKKFRKLVVFLTNSNIKVIRTKDIFKEHIDEFNS